MSQFRRNLKRIVAMSALLAAFAAALLPGGYLPKIAGPCGKELCSCSIIVNQEIPGCASCNTELRHSANPEFRLVESSITEVEEPGIALQVVFSGIISPEKTQIGLAASEQMLETPASASFHLTVHAREISTPPPRA